MKWSDISYNQYSIYLSNMPNKPNCGWYRKFEKKKF